MFYCDPFGHTGPEHLYNFGDDTVFEKGYVFMHDQEPIQIGAHRRIFREVVRRNSDMDLHWQTKVPGVVVVSEHGQQLERLKSIYNWRSAYYFFHAWACLDWYRGYDRTFLFDHPTQRAAPQKTFCSPNRIIGGERSHRVLLMYHLQRRRLLDNNYVSCPQICPIEKISVFDVAQQYSNTYSDIESTLREIHFPLLFQGEPHQLMTSCWLSNFSETTDSLIYVPTETIFFGQRLHLTEKTFKPIALGMPFVLVATAGSLEYLRSYGFQTFSHIWDESYDHEQNDLLRLAKVSDLLADIESLSTREKQQLWKSCLPTIEHNWNHFYHGGLESTLWPELLTCLDTIRDGLAI